MKNVFDDGGARKKFSAGCHIQSFGKGKQRPVRKLASILDEHHRNGEISLSPKIPGSHTRTMSAVNPH